RIVFDELQAQQERLTVLGEVTAVVAHEINNPLAAISMFNQMMADGLDEDSPFQENVDVIARNTASCKRAVRDLLDHVSGAASEIALVDIDEILRDVARFLTPLARRSDVVIDFCPAQRSTQILGDEIRLRQVFVNLVVNGIQSIGNRGGRVSIRVTAFEGSSALRIEVEDDGAGVPEELRTRIFEPFFTTKGGQRGTALRLPTSRRTVEAHGGTLSMQPNEPHGATFVVILPLRTGVSEGSALTELRT
ncbi:MAG: hypothetical protein KDB53_07360, partial [Planctomycetes bacterium]|nr:hypothetical protein [Planctomycetota bacterium]